MSIQYQHPNTFSPEGFEVFEVEKKKVICDGGKGQLGHPRVFLEINNETGDVICPYCSRRFIYVGH